MTVLDASAVLALLHDEPGSDLVADRLDGALLGAANFAEVVGKLVDAELDVSGLRRLLLAAGVRSSRSAPPTPNWLGRCGHCLALGRFPWGIGAASR